MSVQKVLVVELFAIVLALYGGFTELAGNLTSEAWALHAGFYLGLFGLIYGLVGGWIVGAVRNDR